MSDDATLKAAEERWIAAKATRAENSTEYDEAKAEIRRERVALGERQAASGAPLIAIENGA